MKKKLTLFLATAVATVALAAGAGAPAAVADGSVSYGGCCLVVYATTSYTTATNKMVLKDNWNEGYGVRANIKLDGVAHNFYIDNNKGVNQSVTTTISLTGGPNITFNACTRNFSTGVTMGCSVWTSSVY